jgi:hypothetical protein
VYLEGEEPASNCDNVDPEPPELVPVCVRKAAPERIESGNACSHTAELSPTESRVRPSGEMLEWLTATSKRTVPAGLSLLRLVFILADADASVSVPASAYRRTATSKKETEASLLLTSSLGSAALSAALPTCTSKLTPEPELLFVLEEKELRVEGGAKTTLLLIESPMCLWTSVQTVRVWRGPGPEPVLGRL